MTDLRLGRLVTWITSMTVLGCAPLVGNGEDAGARAVDADASDSPDAPPLDSSGPDAPLPDAGTDAPMGPRICNPEDKRVCVVTRPEDGVACPPSWTEARPLACEAYGPRIWQLAECATYLVARWSANGRSESCNYHPVTRKLIGSRGADICGSYCGGVNHVAWGESQLVCGLNPIPPSCEGPPPAGTDAGAGTNPPSDGGTCGEPGETCCPGNRCRVGCCAGGVCRAVGETCGGSAGTCGADRSCRGCLNGDGAVCQEAYCGGLYETCCPSPQGFFCTVANTGCVHSGSGEVRRTQCRPDGG